MEDTAVWSSGIAFYPPSTRFWRIAGKWYDFTDFLSKHPGGSEAIEICRTYVFESHHPNYSRARKVIQKYECDSAQASIPPTTPAATSEGRLQHGTDKAPTELLGDDAFYSVMRRRVYAYLVKSGHADGGPTKQCVRLFWTSFIGWFCTYCLTLWSGSVACAVLLGLTASFLGAFGHNWIHQPRYKQWAYLSLDCIGFSSDGWYREHNLQHHMYTNTPWDNHYHGTDPFLVTDPSVPRHWLQRWITPVLSPVVLSFGLFGNYIYHTTELVKGREKFTFWKLALPVQLSLFCMRWGWVWGVLLMYTAGGTLGIYYFTMALLNHNTAHCMDIPARNKARDWGEAQLASSADWCVNWPFLPSGIWLWLNFHTVHHLFPKTDFSHHPAIQEILMSTCKEHNVRYEHGSPFTLYKQMIGSFASPRSLMRDALVYGGSL